MNPEYRPLADTSAIVTGGARGVGKGVAAALVKAGASVLIVDREAALGRETEEELKAFGHIEFLECDLVDRNSLPGIVDAAVERFGRLDTLVNAAQHSHMLLLADTSVEAMEYSFATGFWPTFLLMRAAYPHLVKSRGSVINFGSGGAFQASANLGSYVAAKEAIRAISKVAATEWGPDGIRVNIVCPYADSPGVQAWAKQAPEEFAEQIAKVSLQRIGDCEKDIGAAIVFLASPAAGYITGQTLMVDGGMTKAF